jgi:MoaE-MoaD fusion protein
MQIRVLLFARLRELALENPSTLELSPGASITEAWEQLARGHDELARMRSVVQAARNKRHVSWDEILEDGDELAFFPPVSGGSGADELSDPADEIWVGSDPIALDETPFPDTETGGTVRFLGIVRGTFSPEAGPDHDPEATADPGGAAQPITRMHYEVYDGMAEAELTAVAREAREQFGVRALRILHRVGDVGVGEVSLLVNVVGTHRKEAFAACGWIVDRIKERVPIWKKELLKDGGRWV